MEYMDLESQGTHGEQAHYHQQPPSGKTFHFYLSTEGTEETHVDTNISNTFNQYLCTEIRIYVLEILFTL